MTKVDQKLLNSRPWVWLIAVVATLLCVWCATPAAATTFEQVGCFAGSKPLDPCAPIDLEKEEFGEEVQLGYVGGMAVNYTGAGGVPAGTVYAVGSENDLSTRVAMFEPEGEGLEFVQSWEVTKAGGPYERCGPLLGEKEGVAENPCSPYVGSGVARIDVEVDQATGNVYVLRRGAVGQKAVVEYSADGSEEITRFGEQALESEPVGESPGKIHNSSYPGGLAVTGAGEVYVFDYVNATNLYRRLMVFRPQSPGEYDNYVYAGEILTGTGITGSGFGSTFAAGPVTDAAGNVYVGAGIEAELIEKYPPQIPAPYPAPPVAPSCSFDYDKSGITAVTVNPLTEEPFFFSYKKPKLVHQLSSTCEGGEFKEVGTIAVAPERDDLWGLAFDPVRELASGRPAGVLYAGAPGPAPSNGVGKGEPGQSSLGYIFASPVEAPPVVKDESVSKVLTTSAQLRAKVDPKGFLTHYVFEYLSEDNYQEAGESLASAAEAPIGGANLEGSGPRSVAATLTSLAPDTAYRFRVVARSNCKPGEPEFVCSTAGPGFAFHTFAPEAPGLPDDRAWELVSPARKNGGQVLPADPRISSCAEVKCKPGATYEHFPMQSAPDGNAVAYEGTPFSSEEGAGTENQYVSRRTPSGWQTANPTPRLLFSGAGAGYRFLSTDLSEAVIGQTKPAFSPEAPLGYENLYSQPVAEPLALEPFVKQAPPNRPAEGAGRFQVNYAGASADGSRVFFEANDSLTEGTSVAPAAEDGGAAEFNLYEWSAGQLTLVNVLPGNAAAPAGAAFGEGENAAGHAISADGQTVFWSDEAGQVYARIGGTETREVKAPGKYLSASTDASKVLLRDGCLYSLETEQCTDLTQGEGGFQGIVGQSEDLSHVYFVDTAVLTGEEENSEGDQAQAGKFNLYAWAEGTTRFVATLAAGDNGGGPYLGISGDWALSPAARTAEASRNGRFVAFLSEAQLTGYGNIGPCDEDSGSGEFFQFPCLEAFVYDSASAKLRCASCNRSGAAPLGLSVLRLIRGPSYLPQPRYLTDSGRLFFDSQDSLVPADTNEGVEDVYQWEPEGVGTCELEEGCARLLSGGREESDSNFLAADPSGANIFFTTRDRLVATDTDDLIDVYDARVDGGFPAPTVSPPAELPLQVPPLELTPASPALNDPGNVKPAKKPCKKGKVKHKGKCVKKRRHGGQRTHRTAPKTSTKEHR